MRKITTLTFLLVSTFGWSQKDSIQVEKKDSIFKSTLINYVQRHSLNPATAGIFNQNNLQTCYQFNIYDSPVTEIFIGFDKSFGKKNGWGIGTNYRTENYNNSIKYKHFGINLSKDLRIKEHTTSFGIGAEYIQVSFNWNNAVFGDMIDPRQGVIYQSGDLPQGGDAVGLGYHTGIAHHWKNLKIGASVLNMNEANLSIIKGSNGTPKKLNFNISYSFKIKDFEITPIYDASVISTSIFKNVHLMTIYKQKYFISMGIQFEEGFNSTNRYQFSGGAFIFNRLYTSISYAITPRYLDYAHVFSIKFAYLFNLKNKK